MHPQSR